MSWSWTNPRTLDSCGVRTATRSMLTRPAKRWSSCTNAAASRRHGSHQAAKKLITSGLPRKLLRPTLSPLMVVAVKVAAGARPAGAGRVSWAGCLIASEWARPNSTTTNSSTAAIVPRATVSMRRMPGWYRRLLGGWCVRQPPRVRGHQHRAGLEVGRVEQLVERVHVTQRDADDAAGDAASRQLDGVQVGAGVTAGRLHLVGDALRVRRLHQALEHLRMHAAAAQHGRPLAQLDVPVLLLAGARVVGGVGHVDRDRDVRSRRVAGGVGAQEAGLLADRGDAGQRGGAGLLAVQANGLGGHERPAAIVSGARGDAPVGQLHQRLLQHRQVADAQRAEPQVALAVDVVYAQADRVDVPEDRPLRVAVGHRLGEARA